MIWLAALARREMEQRSFGMNDFLLLPILTIGSFFWPLSPEMDEVVKVGEQGCKVNISTSHQAPFIEQLLALRL